MNHRSPRGGALALALASALLAHGPTAHAQADDEYNAPPAWADAEEPEGETPEHSAAGQVGVMSAGTSVTVGLLNPRMDASPLWLWVTGEGREQADVAIMDAQDRVLWRSNVGKLGPRGTLVVVPRPAVHAQANVEVVLSVPASTPVKKPLSLMHPRIQQLSLPLVIVGGPEATALAEKLRDRAPERLVHTLPSSMLPTAPAAFLGTGNIILAQDAVIPAAQGRALQLFHCARGGVVMLESHGLPSVPGCDPPAVLKVTAADQLLRALRDHPVGLGILEERAAPGLFTPSVEDAQAAAAMMAGRPPAPLGVALMVLALLLVGGAVAWSRRFTAPRAMMLMAAAPVSAGLVMVAVGAAFGSTLEHVRLVTVDARAGAAVALVRTVDVSRQPLKPSTTDTAWVFQPMSAPSASRQMHVVETVDVIELPPMKVAVDPQAGERSRISVDGGSSLAAFPCRGDDAPDADDDVARAHGRMLKDRCAQLRGSLAQVDGKSLPALSTRLDTGSQKARVGAWLYVFGQGG